MSSKRPFEPENVSEPALKKWKRIIGSSSSSSTSQPTAQQSPAGSAHSAWDKFTNALRGLEKCSIMVPSLQSSISMIAECISEISDADKRRHEFCDLALDLADLIDTLNGYLEKTSMKMLSNCITNIVNALQEDLAHIKNRQKNNRLNRISEAQQEEEDMIKCYRRIEVHFRRLQVNANLGMWSILHEHIASSRLDKLSPAKQARYNSAQSNEPRRRMCNPNTRVGVLTVLHGWTNSPDSPKLYWMNGMAGTGKTTIAYSLCDALQKTCQLGASFFCSRLLPECRDVNRIVPTIAYQLARFSLPFQSALCDALANDPDIGHCDTREQFDSLVMAPLAAARDSMPTNVVVVIDALDECSDSSGTKAILDLLFHHATALPVRFFVTSRPEPTISDKMLALDGQSRSIFVLHEIEKTIVQADIETYLSNELSIISPLPTEDQVRRLAKQAGSLLIYAATVLRYIRPGDPVVDSYGRLMKMLEMVPEPHGRMYHEIDALYTAILEAVSVHSHLDPGDLENVWRVLRTVVCLMEPVTTCALAGLLDLQDERKLVMIMKPLQSVLHISSTNGLVSTLHASFPDYLLSRERSGEHFCDRKRHNQLLARHCFENMKRSLRFNICNLESSFVRDLEVMDLPSRINEAITPELFYACRYWVDHLVESENSQELIFLLEEYLKIRLLYWMETMNLKGYINACALILSKAYGWLLEQSATPSLRKTCLEAQNFVTVFGANPVSQSTPHIYVSLLSFWDKASTIWELYGEWRGMMVKVEGPAISRRSAALAIWENQTSTTSLAFSPNGTRIVSGSYDNTIRVWDAQSGCIVAGPFQGHKSSITSVAYSPDGARIVSGSSDRTIRVWDAQSGRIVAGPFEGHTYRISSVVYSPDGARIVSGSYDSTIRVWDAQSGHVVAGPFEGHTDRITSVAYSPDGARIVSGSYDSTIRVWDAQSGHVVAGPFKGHLSRVTSVAYSPDGTRIVSGSWDRTIRVWEAQSGRVVAGPFEGHTSRFASVAYSPDGARIVSDSDDNTIRVWDAQSGRVVAGPFEGHRSLISSVVYSPDGARIVSGSYDKTIRVWDAQSGPAVDGPFEGHTSWITSVAYSPDGARIVSGSWDQTIRVWDAQSGHVVAGSFEGHTSWISSVAYSPDGTRIISGSYDKTIRVWDAQSGRIVAGPFEGHTDRIISVAYSPDGAHIVSGSYDNTIRVWNVQSGRLVAGPFEGHASRITSVAYSPDGARIVSGSYDSTIRVWDAHSGRVVAGPFEGHASMITSVAYSPDGVCIVSGSWDQTIRVWDAQSGRVIAGPFEGHTDAVTSVAYSPNSARIISGSYDKTIRVWDAQSGRIVAGPFEGHASWITSVAYSPDGTRILSGSSDKTIRVWDVQSGCVIAGLFGGHANEISRFSAAHRQDWKINSEGWLVDATSQILLWLPLDLREVLKTPCHNLLISRQGYCSVDFEGASIGPCWADCISD